ncbi:MAG: internal scaffolding protein [Microvirus sp.]|nr:MAG: internal scaffolding protein [Microvirus sp.]
MASSSSSSPRFPSLRSLSSAPSFTTSPINFSLYCETYFPFHDFSTLTPPPAGYVLVSSDPCQWRTPEGEYVFWSPLPSKTLQGPSADADINVIVNRLNSGAMLPPPTGRGYYGDATASPASLAEALSLVSEARQAFEMLPPMIRQTLGNDPAQLEGFLADPDNRAVAIRHGLIRASEPVLDPVPASPTPTGVPAPAPVGDSGAK